MARFKIYGNEVLDSYTKLVWQRDFKIDISWPIAAVYAESLGDSWRLPTQGELLKLCHPTLEFPDIPFSEIFWSSTCDPDNLSYKGAVCLGACLLRYRHESDCYNVCCVRNGPVRNLIVTPKYNFSLTGRI